MPAKSKVQRKAMAIAKHNPKKLHKKNKGLLKMSKNQLGDFAATPEMGLPKRVKKAKPTQAKWELKQKSPSVKKMEKTEGIEEFMARRKKETSNKKKEKPPWL